MPVHIFWISWVLMRITLFCVALIFVQCDTSKSGTETGSVQAQNKKTLLENAKRLAYGMTKAQVKEILGKPNDVYEYTNIQVFCNVENTIRVHVGFDKNNKVSKVDIFKYLGDNSCRNLVGPKHP